MVFASYEESYSQLNRRSIKKNNKRMSNFRGRKNTFGKDRAYNFFGISLNAFNYFGDLAPTSSFGSTDISFTRPAVGVFFGRRFGPRYSLIGHFRYGTLRGGDFDSADPEDENDRYRYVRNLHFRNRIKELSLTAVFDLFKNEGSYISRVQATPYVLLGLAVFHHNPQAKVNDDSTLPEAGQWVNLRPLGTEGQFSNLLDTDANAGISPYQQIQIAVPIGLGFRYRMNQVLDISFEVATRYLFFDYIDDVSANYVDLGVFDNPLARELSDRSLEATDAVSGAERTLTSESIGPITSNLDTYTGRDGRSYTVIAGYGNEFFANNRGNKDDNDFYFVTTIKVAYVIGARFRRAKFR